MLKATVSSPRDGFYGVEFETVVYGRKSFEHPATFIPCASYAHARAVALAYNGVAFTEERPAQARNGETPTVRHPSELPPHVTPAHDDVVASAQYRGAPMGVADYTAPDATPQDALHFGIARIALNDEGYAPDGVYWGLPQGTLWHALATDHGATMASRWFRAPSYAHAVARVRGEFPNATTQRVPAGMSATGRAV